MPWEPFEDPPDLEGTDLAPEGAVRVCGACGESEAKQKPFDPIAYAGERLKGWSMPDTGRPDEFVFRAPDHEPGSTSGIRVQATHGKAETMAAVKRVLAAYNERQDAKPFDPVAYAREKLVGWDLEKLTNYAVFCAPDWQAGVAGRRCRIFFDDSKEQSTNATSRVLKAYNERQAAEPCKCTRCGNTDRLGFDYDGAPLCQQCAHAEADRATKAANPKPAPEPEACSKCDEPFDVYRRPFFTDICSNCSERETINNEPLDARVAIAQAEHKAEQPKPVKHPWGAWSTATWDAP